MSFCFDFDSANRILRCRFEGLVNQAAISEFYRQIPIYDAATKPRAGINDFSQITSVDITSQTIAKLASLPPAFADESRPRVNVAPRDHVYGLLRMFQAMGEGTRPNLYVVRSLEEAYAILGVTEPRFEQVPLKQENSSTS
jgi:hypothetical protein